MLMIAESPLDDPLASPQTIAHEKYIWSLITFQDSPDASKGKPKLDTTLLICLLTLWAL